MQGKITEDMPDVTTQKKVWMTNGKVVIEVPTVDITAFQSIGFDVLNPARAKAKPKAEPKAAPKAKAEPKAAPKAEPKAAVKAEK